VRLGILQAWQLQSEAGLLDQEAEDDRFTAGVAATSVLRNLAMIKGNHTSLSSAACITLWVSTYGDAMRHWALFSSQWPFGLLCALGFISHLARGTAHLLHPCSSLQLTCYLVPSNVPAQTVYHTCVLETAQWIHQKASMLFFLRRGELFNAGALPDGA
jgi:hypothetical protein